MFKRVGENEVDLTETEQKVIEVLVQRWELGRDKYGKGISHESSPDPIDWVKEAIEEAADLLQYLVAMRESMFAQRRAKEDEDSIVESNLSG